MFSTIRSRVITASIAVLVIALIANAALSYTVARSYNNKTISENLSAVASGHVSGIGEWIASKKQMIVSIQDAALSPDPVPVFKQIASAGNFVNVLAGYEDKTSLFSEPTKLPPDYDPRTRPWYTAAVSAGGPVVTAPYMDVSTGKLIVAFTQALKRDGKLAGVVSGAVAMDSVIDNVLSVHPTPASFAVLVDGKGSIVAHADRKLTGKPLTDLFPDLSGTALKSLIGAAEPLDTHAGTQDVLAHARAVPGTDWTLIIALDKAEATAGMRSMILTSAIALFVIIALGALVVGLVTSIALKRLSSIRDAMDSIGSGAGDLTQRLPADGNDEVAQIARAFNTFIKRLHDVMTRVRDSSESVRLASSEIAAGNQDLSGRTESAAASLQQTAASVEEISSTIAHSTKAANQANVTAASAAATASAGGQVVGEAITMMTEIEDSSNQIGSIIGVIDAIAFQTNILALNAAVEAARAGEQGRGFAVVASEVRGLAARSAQAAKEIKSLVTSTVDAVASGSTQVRSAGETMNEIVGSVANVSTIMAEITDAANEQTRGIQEVNKAVSQLDQMVQQNAALVEQSAAAASALQTQAMELAMAVSEFKLS